MKHPVSTTPGQHGPKPLDEVRCIHADLGPLHASYHQQRRVQRQLPWYYTLSSCIKHHGNET